jgi:hypothetical protein
LSVDSIWICRLLYNCLELPFEVLVKSLRFSKRFTEPQDSRPKDRFIHFTGFTSDRWIHAFPNTTSIRVHESRRVSGDQDIEVSRYSVDRDMD